jgi:hypothetical protein
MQISKVKDDLHSMVRQKLRELGVYPTNITQELKNRINKVKDEELDLRRERKFTKEKGYALLDEIDSITNDLMKLPSIQTTEEEDMYGSIYRKKKSTNPKPKRKPVKKIVKRKK